jgi:DNA mismatch repair protein MutS2
MIETKDLELLQFAQVVQHIKHYCFSKSAAERCEALCPQYDYGTLRPLLQQNLELKNILSAGLYFPSVEHETIEKDIKVLSLEGAMLEPERLLAIMKTAMVADSLIRFLKNKQEEVPALYALVAHLKTNERLIHEVGKILDDDAGVKDSASEELAALRQEIREKRKESDRRFYHAVNTYRKLEVLRDNEEGYFNGRRTLAVMSEHKSQVSGFVHSKSESGRTIFIEPTSIIEINNEIGELEIDEQREIRRVLRELCDFIRPAVRDLSVAYEFLIEMDVLKAKAHFANSIRATLPGINSQFDLKIINAYHPLLYLQNKRLNKTTVPLNVHLDKTERVMVISGPNAGGKTIALKTIGLLQIMLQSGLLIPVHESSSFPIFQNILVDIGDTQSIENELSTYSARLISMTAIVEAANDGSLVLMDEFGSGTDPELGSAIAEAVLESLVNSQTKAIITSHFGNVKILAEELKGAFNACMLFDLEKLEPKFILSVGKPGSSYTFEVAERIGFPKYLITRAKSRLNKDKLKLNTLLAEVQDQKSKLEELLRQKDHETFLMKIAKEKYLSLYDAWEDKQEKEKEQRVELRQQALYGQKYQRLLEDWKNKQERKVVIKRFIDGLTAETKKIEAFEKSGEREKLTLKKVEKLKSSLKVGSKVRVLNGKEIGIVEELLSDKAVLNFGHLKLTAGLESLILVSEKES